MKGYWIVRVSITNPKDYPAYLTAAKPAFDKYGATFLVRGGKHVAKKGAVTKTTPGAHKRGIGIGGF